MTSVTKNMYIDKLNDIVNKCSNTYHSTIKMKLVDVKTNTYIDSSKKNNEKDPTFKIGDTESKYQNIKILLQKVTLRISLKKFL